ncbi:N-terminal Xaa-Pro-Lys N-methyltransferase 1 [Homalodisca vitripennis]|uniref:N-terminal Xaa-Pro-Lys N-methyltransferase 1 n=1 Tax=Homalodisca vitripennis TaxID=197043 RepID=UPI001EEAF38B|nr:N-terminal Xaa-Pro-Lys N-methyltransferase 1 [Homalodisca vitripennis]
MSFDDTKDTQENINYLDAITYWTHIPPTVDGMLGGFGFISSVDIQGSEQFLKTLFQLKKPPGKDRALDCGAGIGRVTKHVLSRFFAKVDLVEPIESFIKEAPNYIKNSEKVGELFNVGLQDFKPCTSYDVVWCQWVLAHLTNPDLISFLRTCGKSLKPNGVIVVKENLSSCEEGDMDKNDSSRTRHENELKKIFISAGLKITKEAVQKKFPKELYRVKMYALRPDSSYVMNEINSS